MDLHTTYRLLPFVAGSFQMSERGLVVAQADVNNGKARRWNPLALVNLVKLVQQRPGFPHKTGRPKVWPVAARTLGTSPASARARSRLAIASS